MGTRRGSLPAPSSCRGSWGPWAGGRVLPAAALVVTWPLLHKSLLSSLAKSLIISSLGLGSPWESRVTSPQNPHLVPRRPFLPGMPQVPGTGLGCAFGGPMQPTRHISRLLAAVDIADTPRSAACLQVACKLPGHRAPPSSERTTCGEGASAGIRAQGAAGSGGPGWPWRTCRLFPFFSQVRRCLRP